MRASNPFQDVLADQAQLAFPVGDLALAGRSPPLVVNGSDGVLGVQGVAHILKWV